MVASEGKGGLDEVSVFLGTSCWERGRELVGGGKWSSHSPDVGDLEPERKGADAEGEKKRTEVLANTA